MSTETRKQQIVHAALGAIAEYGIQGATITRIAKGAGITPAALYYHFENRRAILVAALDKVYEQIVESFGGSSNDDPVARIRQIIEHHAQKVASQDRTSHAHLFLEFVASAPEEGLREVLREKELETNARLASLVEDYQQRGRLPRDIDADGIAWLIASWAWTGTVANLMDVTPTWSGKVSPLLVEFILGRISQNPGPSQGQADSSCLPMPAPGQAEQDGALPGLDEAQQDGLPDGAVFTVEETAGILKVPAATVSALVREKRIASLSLGEETRIPRRALVALLRGPSE